MTFISMTQAQRFSNFSVHRNHLDLLKYWFLGPDAGGSNPVGVGRARGCVFFRKCPGDAAVDLGNTFFKPVHQQMPPDFTDGFHLALGSVHLVHQLSSPFSSLTVGLYVSNKRRLHVESLLRFCFLLYSHFISITFQRIF